MKSLLRFLDGFAGEDAPRVRAALDPALLAAVGDSAGPEWLPVELNARLARAVHDALGRERCVRYFRAHQLESFGSPLLRSVIQGAAAVFGMSPGSWLRLLPTAWGLVYRECGRWSAPRAAAGGAVEVDHEEVPPELLVDDVWPTCVAAALSAVVDATRTSGAMRVVAVEARARRARYELRWSAAA